MQEINCWFQQPKRQGKFLHQGLKSLSSWYHIDKSRHLFILTVQYSTVHSIALET
jgi:hypothetical protein